MLSYVQILGLICQGISSLFDYRPPIVTPVQEVHEIQPSDELFRVQWSTPQQILNRKLLIDVIYTKQYWSSFSQKQLKENCSRIDGLFQQGATPNIILPHRNIPIFHLILNRAQLFENFVRAGVDINMQNAQKESSLHRAIIENIPEVVTRLCSLGADTRIQNEKGDTALHYAANQLNYTIIETLIVYGADIHAKNNIGQTPLDIARCNDAIHRPDYIKIIELLQAHSNVT